MEVVTNAPNNTRYCANHTFSLHASDISTSELNTSPKLGTYTPGLFTLSSTRVLVPRLDVTVTCPIVLNWTV